MRLCRRQKFEKRTARRGAEDNFPRKRKLRFPFFPIFATVSRMFQRKSSVHKEALIFNDFNERPVKKRDEIRRVQYAHDRMFPHVT